MAGYVVLAILLLVCVWFVVHLRPNPPLPKRRPFEPDDGDSLPGQKRQLRSGRRAIHARSTDWPDFF
jgi:hypothetical protein